MDGRCVSLNRGRLSDPLVWHIDPIKKARAFAAAGASWMHVTDLDAVAGQGDNHELIVELIRQSGISVQIAGGLRSMERIKEWIELGVGRVVLGTLAALNPILVKNIAKLYPDQVIVAVDVWRGSVMTHGWQQPSALNPADFVGEFQQTPLAGIIVTDIDSDVKDRENTFELLDTLAEIVQSPVIASGVVRNLEDIDRLVQNGNVSGAIVGTALYDKTIDLEEAIEAAQPRASTSIH